MSATGASWSISSKKDPRWDASGRCAPYLSAIDEACRYAVEVKTKLYGDPPDDLEYGGTKD